MVAKEKEGKISQVSELKPWPAYIEVGDAIMFKLKYLLTQLK